jgi:hypothetical protein
MIRPDFITLDSLENGARWAVRRLVDTCKADTLAMQLKNQPVIAVYEAQANLADHEKIQGTDGNIFRSGT